MVLTSEQLNLLAIIVSDVAKAVIISAFVVPAVVSGATLFASLRTFLTGCFLGYIALILIKWKEEL